MKKIAALGLIAALLAGCGGGDDNAAPAATAEGFWEGRSSTGVDVALAILENGQTWGIYTANNTLVGALYGNTTSSGTTLSGSGRDFNLPSRTVEAGTYSGTFTPKRTITVKTSGGGAFTGTYNAEYEKPASLAALAGTFYGWGISGNSLAQTISATISTSGAITVPSSQGCSAAGRASPRASGKNIFDISITFSGSTCALGNGKSAAGIAYYDSASREVLVMAMNEAKSDGFIFAGQK